MGTISFRLFFSSFISSFHLFFSSFFSSFHLFLFLFFSSLPFPHLFYFQLTGDACTNNWFGVTCQGMEIQKVELVWSSFLSLWIFPNPHLFLFFFLFSFFFFFFFSFFFSQGEQQSKRHHPLGIF